MSYPPPGWTASRLCRYLSLRAEDAQGSIQTLHRAHRTQPAGAVEPRPAGRARHAEGTGRIGFLAGAAALAGAQGAREARGAGHALRPRTVRLGAPSADGAEAASPGSAGRAVQTSAGVGGSLLTIQTSLAHSTCGC